MLNPVETSNYERSSNVAAGLCASCFKSLDADEVHCCNECAHDAYIETDPNGVMNDGD